MSKYLIVAHQRNAPPPGQDDDAVLLEIDRNTGILTGNVNQNYTLGSSEGFISATLYNNQIYTCGRYTIIPLPYLMELLVQE